MANTEMISLYDQTHRPRRRRLSPLIAAVVSVAALVVSSTARADDAESHEVGTVVAETSAAESHPVFVPPAGDRFLARLELPRAGAGAAGSPLAHRTPASGDTPALVPLAPPVWVGLGMLGALALTRHKQRRRARVADLGVLQ